MHITHGHSISFYCATCLEAIPGLGPHIMAGIGEQLASLATAEDRSDCRQDTSRLGWGGHVLVSAKYSHRTKGAGQLSVTAGMMIEQAISSMLWCCMVQSIEVGNFSCVGCTRRALVLL